jgi:excisionase family DNA binding protein
MRDTMMTEREMVYRDPWRDYRAGEPRQPLEPELMQRLTTKQKIFIRLPDNDGLLTRNQAAAYLNITDEQMAAFIKDGTLDYINVGRGTKRPRYRIAKQDLDAFIERRRQKEVQCLSTSKRSPRSTTMPSKSVVVGFTALRNAQLARKPKPSKP